jgi:hypothetical protein
MIIEVNFWYEPSIPGMASTNSDEKRQPAKQKSACVDHSMALKELFYT